MRSRWVIAAFRDGIITAFKVGKEWRCTESALEEYVKEKAQRGAI